MGQRASDSGEVWLAPQRECRAHKFILHAAVPREAAPSWSGSRL